MKCVDQIFAGNMGRTLRANRLLYSTSLAPIEGRLNSIIEAPLRPFIADKNGLILAWRKTEREKSVWFATANQTKVA